MISLAITLALLPLKNSHAPLEAPNTATTRPAVEIVKKSASTDATAAVRRGDLTTAIDALGYLEAVDPMDVRIRPKAYGGELTITSVTSNGAKVAQGEILLQIDPAPIDRQIAAAGNERDAAHANLTHAQAEAEISREQDELSMKMQLDATSQAHDAIKWFETVDGPNMLEGIDLGLKFAKANLDDQQDELDQLKKMYKSEDLTTDTADIVVKRAVRRLEMLKSELKMEQDRAQKTKSFIYPAQKQHVLDAARQADEQLAQLKAAQAQARVLRDTSLKSARAGTEAADQKLADLKADREKLTIRAPADGIVLYGQFAGGGFNAAEPHSLQPGERIAPQQVVMTFYTPGKLRLHLELPEQKFFTLHPGDKAVVTASIFPDQKIAGTCDACPAVDVNTPQGPLYRLTVSLSDVDGRLVPGMRANFHADAIEATDAMLVPNSAISGGYVWVKDVDGGRERRTVVAGKSDGKQTAIIHGLSVGEEVFVEAGR